MRNLYVFVLTGKKKKMTEWRFAFSISRMNRACADRRTSPTPSQTTPCFPKPDQCVYTACYWYVSWSLARFLKKSVVVFFVCVFYFCFCFLFLAFCWHYQNYCGWLGSKHQVTISVLGMTVTLYTPQPSTQTHRHPPHARMRTHTLTHKKPEEQQPQLHTRRADTILLETVSSSKYLGLTILSNIR